MMMIGQNLMKGVKVIRAILQCHWTHTCDYYGAVGTKVFVMGGFVATKTNVCFNAMSVHELRMTHRENGERNVCELDHYAP